MHRVVDKVHAITPLNALAKTDAGNYRANTGFDRTFSFSLVYLDYEIAFVLRSYDSSISQLHNSPTENPRYAMPLRDNDRRS